MDQTQRNAAKDLGHDRISWDTGENAPAYDEKYWKDLTKEEQQNAMIIGYTEETWDNPAYYCYDWNYLSDEHKNAASVLGFGRNSWSFECAN